MAGNPNTDFDRLRQIEAAMMNAQRVCCDPASSKAEKAAALAEVDAFDDIAASSSVRLTIGEMSSPEHFTSPLNPLNQGQKTRTLKRLAKKR